MSLCEQLDMDNVLMKKVFKKYKKLITAEALRELLKDVQRLIDISETNKKTAHEQLNNLIIIEVDREKFTPDILQKVADDWTEYIINELGFNIEHGIILLPD